MMPILPADRNRPIDRDFKSPLSHCLHPAPGAVTGGAVLAAHCSRAGPVGRVGQLFLHLSSAAWNRRGSADALHAEPGWILSMHFMPSMAGCYLAVPLAGAHQLEEPWRLYSC